MQLMGVIKQVNSYDLVVSLPNHLTGFVPVDAISLSLKENPTDLTELGYKAGQFVVCRVSQVTKDGKRKRIQLSMMVGEEMPADLTVGQVLPVEVVAVEEKGYVGRLSVRKSERVAFLKSPHPLKPGQTVMAVIVAAPGRTVQLCTDLGIPLKDSTILTVGSCVEGQLVEKQDHHVKLQVGPHSVCVDNTEYNDNELIIGQKLPVRIIGREGNDWWIGSLRAEILALRSPRLDSMPVELIDAQVVKVDPKNGLTLASATDRFFVHISRISDEHVSKIPSSLRVGKQASLRVIDRDPWAHLWQATMQPSLLKASLLSYEQLSPGALIKGTVKRKLENGGVLVAITEHVQALCPLLQLAETAGACSSLQERMQEGQALRWRVLEVDAAQRKLVVTRKRGLLDSELPVCWDVAQLKTDCWLDGQVVAIGKAYGAMVRFYGQLKGLLPLGEMTEQFEKDPLTASGIFVGQVIRVRVVKCEAQGKVILSLRKSSGPKKDDKENKVEEGVGKKEKTSKKEIASKEKASKEKAASKKQEATVEATIEDNAASIKENGVKEDVKEVEVPKKRAVKQEMAEKKSKLTLDDFAEEEVKVESTIMVPSVSHSPLSFNLAEVSDEFQRKLISQPNSSLLWIQWMSTLLRAGEVEGARGVAERALTTISQREDQERLNVWIALLNLENRFGDEASCKRVFERACVACDPLTVHLQQANLLGGRVAEDRQSGMNTRDSPSFTPLNQLWQQMRKKWPGSGKVWVGQAQQLYTLNLLTEARQLQTQALKSLPTRKHVKTVCRWSQLEYAHGSVERARTLFEGLLAQAPRRLDLWSIYVTMEENLVKSKSEGSDILQVRRIYERCLAGKLSTKKARSLFKRWLEFEREHGDGEGVELVKSLAQRYVESMSN